MAVLLRGQPRQHILEVRVGVMPVEPGQANGKPILKWHLDSGDYLNHDAWSLTLSQSAPIHTSGACAARPRFLSYLRADCFLLPNIASDFI